MYVYFALCIIELSLCLIDVHLTLCIINLFLYNRRAFASLCNKYTLINMDDRYTFTSLLNRWCKFSWRVSYWWERTDRQTKTASPQLQWCSSSTATKSLFLPSLPSPLPYTVRCHKVQDANQPNILLLKFYYQFSRRENIGFYRC